MLPGQETPLSRSAEILIEQSREPAPPAWTPLLTPANKPCSLLGKTAKCAHTQEIHTVATWTCSGIPGDDFSL